MSRVQTWWLTPGWPWLLGLVLQAAAPSVQAIEARVRAALDLQGDAWVGQQVELQIDLMTNGLSFSGQRMHLPDVPGALVLEDAVSTVKLSERIEGETWQVLGYRFPLFPQRAGRFEIGPMAVAFQVSEGYGSEPVAFDLQTEALSFQTRIPPGVDDPSELVTSKDFSFQVAVTPEAVDLQVGDALSRTVTRRAVDVSGMAFAPLPLPEIPGLASYAKTPELNDSINRGELQGSRIDSVTYVLQQPGEFNIPEIRLQWWDPVAERLHTETIPALTLTVAAKSGQASVTDALQPVLNLVSMHPWWAGSALFGITAALWVVYRWTPLAQRRFQHWRLARRRSEPARFKRLLRAARRNDPSRIYNAYVQWISGEDSPTSDELGNPQLTRQLEYLQTAMIQHDSAWRADTLLREVQRVRRLSRRTQRRSKTQALPNLNPLGAARHRYPH